MSRRVLMLAAENDALPGGKVGGIGDVIRDVPPVLAARGCRVSVLTPAYGRFAGLPGAERTAALDVDFAGEACRVDLYRVPAASGVPGVEHLVLDHPGFAVCGQGCIYCDDPPTRPFARDATKFALFCAAAATLIARETVERPDVVHLHDWHAALVLLLRRYDPACASLQATRCVFTIHNLALQGVRPLRGDASSLAEWFPRLRVAPADVADPRWPECINPMAVGIRLADAVHAVSPSYAEEILRPGAVETRGRHGGEGLEGDLVAAREEGRLFGILNGCAYPDPPPVAPSWSGLGRLLRDQVLAWAGSETSLHPAHFVARERLSLWPTLRPETVVTTVGRLTAQKTRLLRAPDDGGRPALEGVLERLGEHGIYIVLGTGDPDEERFFTATAGRHANLLFLRGYSDAVARALYAGGDLFLMPSSFEPCGIGQMLAMRAGQPCLVHRVGGLRDTVRPGVDGFGFEGSDLSDQAGHLLAALDDALALRRRDPERWKEIATAAAAARFDWNDSVRRYLETLYASPPADEDRSRGAPASARHSPKGRRPRRPSVER